MTNLVRLLLVILLLTLAFTSLLHAAPLVDPFYAQLKEVQGHPPLHAVLEEVSPFSGYLRLVHTDVHLPGNGGFDLKILRTYNSAIWGRRDGAGLNVFVADKHRSPLGIGWTLHMGIVRNPFGVGASVEMPDGSTHPLYTVNATTFISKGFWVYKVLANGVFELALADGTVYTFQFNTNAGYVDNNNVQVAQVTNIRNAANTASISIAYNKTIGVGAGQGYSYLKTITDSVNRVITFNYITSLAPNYPYINHTLTSIVYGNKTLMSYEYQQKTISAGGPFTFLLRARSPLASQNQENPWTYSYYDGTVEHGDLRTITYPAGGTITYEHGDIGFHTGALPLVKFRVVTKRTTGGRGISPGVWTYQYATGGSSGNITTITAAPDSIKEVHTFNAWGNYTEDGTTSTNYNVWRIGLPKKKEIFLGSSASPFYSEVTGWASGNAISADDISNPSWNNNGGSIKDTNIYVPWLTSRSVTRDGKTYSTSYSNYDQYGNPRLTSETGDKTRSTSINYYVYNTTRNIVQNKPHTVTVTGGLPGSFATTYTYDMNSGNVTRISRYGVVTDFTYDGSGNLDTVTDSNNNRTYFDWSNGRISRRQNPVYTVRTSINSDGTIASETNGRNYTTNYTYDANLRLKTIAPPLGNTTTITYPSDNSYKRVQRSGSGYFSDTKFDGFGRPSGTSDSIGIVTDIAYWAYGPRKTSSSNVGDTVNHDVFERVGTIVHRDNSTIRYTYAGSNVTVTDEAGKDTVYTYNAFGNPDEKLLVSVKDAMLNTTSYSYNILGSLTSIAQGGVTRAFTYDTTKNFLLSESHPEKGAISYTRDNVGNIKTRTDGQGTATYTYDGLNRLTQIALSSKILTFAYDGADNRTIMDSSDAKMDYTYDAVNRLTRKTEVIGGKTYYTDYAYDNYDNLTSITYPSGRRVTYGYNTHNQVTSVSGFGGSINSIAYGTSGTAIGLLKSYAFSNGHTVTLSYNSRNLMTQIHGAAAVNMAYGYDSRGNTTSLTNYIDRTQDLLLEYDDLNRLTRFNNGWGQYAYDGTGNRLSKAFGSNATSYAYTNNQLISETSGGITTTYQYNADGDLTNINNNSRKYLYDPFHNLIELQKNGASAARYSYDADGMRVSKTVDGKTVVYHYDQGGRVLSENDENKSLIADYVYLHGKLVAKIATLPPAAPANLAVTRSAAYQVDLAWKDLSDNEAEFWVERASSVGGPFSRIAVLGPNVQSHTDRGLTPLTTYYYRVVAVNAVGSSLSNVVSATTPADTTPTTGSIVINGNALTTNKPQVTLTLSASDDSGQVSFMQFSNDNITWSAAETYATTRNWSLSAGDGIKHVYARFQDPVGLWSIAYDASIVLDTTPPIVSISSPTTGLTNNATPLLVYSVSDGAVVVTVDGAVVSKPSGSTLDRLNDGLRLIRVEARDAAGNKGAAEVTLDVDTVPPSETVFTKIAAGGMHTAVIKSDGTLWAWGYNAYGQLGDGTTVDKYSPVRIGTGDTWVAVAAGLYHTAALKADGTLWAWGYNAHGQLGDGTTTQRNAPVQIGSGTTWVAVSTRLQFTMAVRSDGTLWAWGYNAYGQLGEGTTTTRTAPVQVGSESNWRAISAGGQHALAIKTDGTLWAWGYNLYGQLGNGTTVQQAVPVQIGSETAWAAVSAGEFHSMAVKTAGSLWAWGYNANGRLGDGTSTNRTVPAQIGTDTNWSLIEAGGLHSMAVKADGSLWTWGYNGYGELGDGTTVDRSSPTRIGNDLNWFAVSAGRYHSAALKSNGRLSVWGDNSFGQVGDGSTSNSNMPGKIGTDTTWATVAAGGYHTLALKTDGSLWAWGLNSYGQLGDGTKIQRNAPVQIGADTTWTAISAGRNHSVALRSDGTLWTWGINNHGQLGDGMLTQRSAPVQIGVETNWAAVSSGANHVLALRTDGTLWSWGHNAYGQLGDNTTTTRTAPGQVAAGTNWTAVAAGGAHSLARKADGTLWAWGYNAHGQLGDGTTTQRTLPVQVGTAVSWAMVTAGFYHTAALSSDGTLWAWGLNTNGQVGDGTGTNRRAPSQIAAGSIWSSVTAGDFHTLARKADGSLWTWGLNSYGQLGDGTTVQRSSPVWVAVDAAWSMVSAGMYHSAAVSADGALWAWGYNAHGQLGSRVTLTTQAPHQIATLGNIAINHGAVYTNSASVLLTMTASDNHGVVQMQFSTDGTAWSAAEPYATSRSWTLSSGEGTRTVYVRYQDGAGNWSGAYSDMITLDTVAPTGSILINDGKMYTTSRKIMLKLTGADLNGVSQMQFSSDGTTWSAAEPYATTRSWTLTPGDGSRTVYVRFMDTAGNLSQAYSDTIVLDTTCNAYPVLIISTSVACYSTIQAAYDAAPDGATLQIRDLGLVENVLMTSSPPKSVTVNGGCNGDYSSCTGMTLLKGALRINTGTVTIKNITLQK